MPLVTIDALEDVFTAEQKRELIRRVTEAVVSVGGEALRSVTWVRIQEFERDAWTIGEHERRAAEVRPRIGLAA
ncbi:tautomerase family protein [Candidatus Binatia bacterium]|nr:tautomerase family protein [Candidatus Binatia bacterium]